jgi:putative SOS response-associated peptidase YedK
LDFITESKTISMDFNKAMERKRALIPKSGFNVVCIDPFEMPDEALYRIAHTATLAEAERIAEEKRKEGIRVFIYDKDTE